MCWKEKIQWQSVTNGLRKEHVLRPPFLDKVLHHFFFLMVFCNSLLLLKSLPINIINCIKFYVNCSALTGRRVWLAIQIFVCLFICKSSPMIHCGNRGFLVVTWQMFEKWRTGGGIVGSGAESCCNGVWRRFLGVGWLWMSGGVIGEAICVGVSDGG